MDEYDVFLDESARFKTLEMLKEHALGATQKNKQFIIVTPHSLNKIATSKNVRIHGLKPPERSSAHGLQQQVLPNYRNSALEG